MDTAPTAIMPSGVIWMVRSDRELSFASFLIWSVSIASVIKSCRSTKPAGRGGATPTVWVTVEDAAGMTVTDDELASEWTTMSLTVAVEVGMAVVVVEIGSAETVRMVTMEDDRRVGVAVGGVVADRVAVGELAEGSVGRARNATVLA